MSENNSKTKYILIFLGVVLICSASIYYFSSISKNVQIENTNIPDEIKKKELELKERELDLKEKELKEKNNPNSNFEISDNSLNKFVNEWVGYQNNKNYSAYINCYSTDFKGIKRTKSGKTTNYNYSEWTEDRIKMYSSAKNLFISTADFEVKQINNTSQAAVVIFMQYYTSAGYSDEGKKMLKIKNENGIYKIYFEELFYSTDTIPDEEGC